MLFFSPAVYCTANYLCHLQYIGLIVLFSSQLELFLCYINLVLFFYLYLEKCNCAKQSVFLGLLEYKQKTQNKTWVYVVLLTSSGRYYNCMAGFLILYKE